MKLKLLNAAIVAAATIATTDAAAYSISGRYIYDDAGSVVQLRGVNWFGFATTLNSVQGLWARNWKEMIQQMKDQGFNAVRLPICPATLRGVTAGGIDYYKNPDLKGKNSLQMLDAIVDELGRQGMYVLLNHDRPDCQNIPALWYTSSYSESQWLSDLRLLASRYADNPNVIGIDLKNEPYGAASWGSGNTSNDWNLATGRASAQVLGIAPHWLIFVEGVSGWRNCTSGQGSFWGEDFGAMKCTPSPVPANRLVLSPHSYGPDVYQMPHFSASNFPYNMPAIWEGLWGFATSSSPVVLGEFGGRYGEGDYRDKPLQNALVDYLISKGINSGFYWCWNPNSPDTGGILRDDWKTVRSDKMDLLKRLWSSNGGSISGNGSVTVTPAPAPAPAPTPTPEPTPAPTTSTFTVTQKVTQDWGAGYCADVSVRNNTTSTQTWKITMTVEGKLYQAWNVSWSQSGTQVTASGSGNNKNVTAGSTALWGYCSNR